MNLPESQPIIRKSLPLTFWAGLLVIVGCELLLFCDVLLTHRGVVKTDAQIIALANPVTLPANLGRMVAPNMTPFAWFGFILLMDGVLETQQDSPARCRPHHFILLALASVPLWCFFDTVNFYSIHAWDYIGMPPDPMGRFIGYFLAFATIVPGMLMSGQMLMNGNLFDWARTRGGIRVTPVVLLASFIAGVLMILWPIIHPDPITNLTLWTSLVFLLDPINYALGRPSMWRDWQNGWYGRTLACMAGGLLCGFLWEFWNYWALSKWIYHLPFLGSFENYRYFEMPLPGLLGFLPFGLECWVMWQLVRIPLDGLVEPLPDERHLL